MNEVLDRCDVPDGVRSPGRVRDKSEDLTKCNFLSL